MTNSTRNHDSKSETTKNQLISRKHELVNCAALEAFSDSIDEALSDLEDKYRHDWTRSSFKQSVQR